MKTLAYCLSKVGKALSEAEKGKLLEYAKHGMTEQESISHATSLLHDTRKGLIEQLPIAAPKPETLNIGMLEQRGGKSFFDVAGISNSMSPKDVLLTQLRMMILGGQHLKYSRFGDMAEEAKILSYDAALSHGWSQEQAERIKRIDIAKLRQPARAFNVGLERAAFGLEGVKPGQSRDGLKYDGKSEMGHAWTDLRTRASFVTKSMDAAEVEGVRARVSKGFGQLKDTVDQQLASTSIAANDKVGGVTRADVGKMLATGDQSLVQHLREAVKVHGVQAVHDMIRDEAIFEVRAARSIDARQVVILNFGKLQPQLEEALELKDKAVFALSQSDMPERTARGERWVAKAKKELPVTSDFQKGLFLLPDGTYISQSPSQRLVNRSTHGETIGQVVGEDFAGSPNDMLMYFMNEGGAIRTWYSPGQGMNVDIIGPPTSMQMGELAEVMRTLRNYDEDFIVDISDKKGRIILSERLQYPLNISKLEGLLTKAYTPKGARFSLERLAFSGPGEETAGRSAAINKSIAKVIKGWVNAPATIVAVDSLDSVPEEHKQIMSDIQPDWQDQYDKGAAKGVLVQAKDGDFVYIFANNVYDVEEAQKWMLDEVIGHYGFRGAFGNSANSILDQVWLGYGSNAEMRKLIKDYYGDRFSPKDATHRRRIAEEYIAHVVRKAETETTKGEQSLLDRVLVWLKNTLRKFGFDVNFGSSELQSVIRKSREFVEKGRGVPVTGVAFGQRQPAPWLYSALVKATEDPSLPAKSQSIPNFLRKKGVSQEEIKWLELDEWIKDNTVNGKVDRMALQAFVKANWVEIREIERDDQSKYSHPADIDNPITRNFWSRLLHSQPRPGMSIEGETAREVISNLFTYQSHQKDIWLNSGTSFNVSDKTKDTLAEIGEETNKATVPGDKKAIKLINSLPRPLIEDFIYIAYEDFGIDWIHPEYMPPTKFGSYFTDIPGGQNYRELEVILPTKTNEDVLSEYNSPHWEEGNVAFHILFDERIGEGGNKTLYVIEAQSDWGQAMGKYRDTPDMPFKHNWPALIIKRAIRWAAEHGFDRVAFPSAETLIKRWGSDQFMWHKVKEGTWNLTERQQYGGHAAGFDLQSEAERLAAEGRFNQSKTITIDSKEDVDAFIRIRYSSDQYEERYINRKVDQLWSAIQKSPESGALLPRKEGMQKFYGEVIPNLLKKFVKQWGGDVEAGGVKKEVKRMYKVEHGLASAGEEESSWYVRSTGGEVVAVFENTEEGKIAAMSWALRAESVEKKQSVIPAYTVAITPEMRESAIYEGFAAFALEAPPDALGQYIGRQKVTLGEKLSEAFDVIQTREFRQRIGYKVFDKLGPIKSIVGDVPYKMARLSTGAPAAIDTLLRHGMLRLDPSGVFTTDTTKQGFIPWLHTIGKDASKFLYWMAARRAELLEGQGRENWLDAKARSEIYQWAGARDNPEWVQKAKEFDAWNKSVLDLAQHAGLIDPAERSQWEQEFYVPFYRLKDDAVAWHEYLTAPQRSKKFISAQIRKLKGGQFQLGDPLENTLKNWMHLITESMNNMARKETAEWTQRTAPGEITEVSYKDLHMFRRGTGTNKRMTYVMKRDQRNVLVYQKDGKPVYIKVESPDLFNAMSGVDSNVLDGVLAKMFSIPKRTLTLWATMTPAFRVANLIRDTMHTAMIDKDFKPFIDSIRGLRKVWQQDLDYVRMMASGAGFGASYIRAEDSQAAAKFVQSALRREKQGIVLNSLTKAWDWYERLGIASENAARVMGYANKTRQGASALDAAFTARDYLDFTMRGSSSAVQFLIHTIPFLNARMQGLYKLGGTAVNPDTRQNLLLRGTMMMVASLALWGAYKDDERYKELEEWDKMTYYHWWVGDYHVRMPKPFEVGAFFSSIPESIANYWNGNEEGKHVGKVVWETIRQAISLDVPQAIKPLVEWWANKSFFTDRPIVGEHLQGLIPSEQADPWTPESAKALGKVLNLPPNKIKSIIEGYFAVLGTVSLAGTDFLMKMVGDYPEEVEKRIDDMPLVGRFIKEADNPRFTRSQSKFYELFDEYDKLAKTMAYYRRMGDVEKAVEMANENRPIISVGKDMAKTKEELRKLRANMRLIANSSLSSEDKTQRIEAFMEKRNRIVKSAYDRAAARLER